MNVVPQGRWKIGEDLRVFVIIISVAGISPYLYEVIMLKYGKILKLISNSFKGYDYFNLCVETLLKINRYSNNLVHF